MELSVSATDRTAWVAMTPAVRLCQPRLLQSGAGEGELLPSPATPSPKSTQPNRRGHNFENRTFHLLQKPDILTCYRQCGTGLATGSDAEPSRSFARPDKREAAPSEVEGGLSPDE